jgi:sigma-E factor negative regulatory protein RseA
MSEPSKDAHDPAWLLSALADGEADASDCARGVTSWADGDGANAGAWHAYHLIGDVLRSEDLASAPGRDRAFLERLRSRLAQEPAVPAAAPVKPEAVATVRAARRAAWMLPAALAAGVMALGSAVVLVGWGNPGSGSTAALLASGPAQGATEAGAARVAPNAAAPVPQAMVADARLVRDAQLDRYLRAHREYGASLPASLPGNGGRNLATVAFER